MPVDRRPSWPDPRHQSKPTRAWSLDNGIWDRQSFSKKYKEWRTERPCRVQMLDRGSTGKGLPRFRYSEIGHEALFNSMRGSGKSRADCISERTRPAIETRLRLRSNPRTDVRATLHFIMRRMNSTAVGESHRVSRQCNESSWDAPQGVRAGAVVGFGNSSVTPTIRTDSRQPGESIVSRLQQLAAHARVTPLGDSHRISVVTKARVEFAVGTPVAHSAGRGSEVRGNRTVGAAGEKDVAETLIDVRSLVADTWGRISGGVFGQRQPFPRQSFLSK